MRTALQNARFVCFMFFGWKKFRREIDAFTKEFCRRQGYGVAKHGAH